MKKALTLFLSMLILLAVLIPGPTAQAVSKKTQVFQYLTQRLGFNSAASCGILANIEHESEFNPKLVIRDRNGLLSGGLCQWNGGRFTNLRNFCNDRGYDYLTIEGQLEYLGYELQKDSFKHIYNYLMQAPNTEEGAYNAAYYWCYYFEIPSNRAAKAIDRGNAAVSKYWPVYCFLPIGTVKLRSAADGKTMDLDDVASVKWSAVEGSVEYYKVVLAEKRKGAFDWEHAQTCAVPFGTNGIDFDLSDLKPGRYAVRVFGASRTFGVEGKCGNTIKFTVDCLTHDFNLKKERLPSFSKEGKRVYICAQCGETKTVTIEKLTESAYAKNKVKGFFADKIGANGATLHWEPLEVSEGYRIWQKVDDTWVKLKTVSAKTTSFKVVGLNSCAAYAFRIASLVRNGAKEVLSSAQELELTTRPEATSLTDATGKTGGRVSLKWKRVKGVDGYIVYKSKDPAGEMEETAVVSNWWPATTLRELDENTRYFFSVSTFVDTENGRIVSERSNLRYAVTK